jgi:hypothetical protein
VDWFGKEKWAAVSKLTTETVHLPGDSLLLRFEDAHSASESQSSAIRILGQDAFFDITHPDRILAVPPALR